MRKGYTIEKLKFLGGLLPGIMWQIITPSKAKYVIRRYDHGGRDYSYILEYASSEDEPASQLYGSDDGLTSREKAIKIIYACEEHGKFNDITEMIHFVERLTV